MGDRFIKILKGLESIMTSNATNSPHVNHPKSVLSRLAIIFAGQGSQSQGMYADWATQYPQVNDTFSTASAALGFDLWAVCQGTIDLSLDDTAYTQPALLTASMAIWQILQQEFGFTPSRLQGSYLAGHSLGEYSALCAAGVFSLTDAVKLVHQRGQLMSQAMHTTEGDKIIAIEGKMAAVLGLEDEQVRVICEMVRENNAVAIVNPANFNSPGQVVIAGNALGVDLAVAQVSLQGNRSMPLKVSVPSHCELMHPATEQLAETLHAMHFNAPQIPVIQNRHARVEADIAAIKQALIEQLSMPVLWSKTQDLLANKHIALQIECGSGNILTNLAKRQHHPITTLATDKVTKLDKIREILA